MLFISDQHHAVTVFCEYKDGISKKFNCICGKLCAMKQSLLTEKNYEHCCVITSLSLKMMAERDGLAIASKN